MQPSVRLWEKKVSLNLECRSSLTGEGDCITIPFCCPCFQHDEWMRASDKDRPCKEQGTIPDHPGNGSSGTQKWAVATVSVCRGARGNLLVTARGSQGTQLEV